MPVSLLRMLRKRGPALTPSPIETFFVVSAESWYVIDRMGVMAWRSQSSAGRPSSKRKATHGGGAARADLLELAVDDGREGDHAALDFPSEGLGDVDDCRNTDQIKSWRAGGCRTHWLWS